MAASGPDDNVVIIKKYANRRLYDTESSSYITLERLAEMVRQKREFKVVDAKTGDDITHNVLTQIIMDEESRGKTMLPMLFAYNEALGTIDIAGYRMSKSQKFRNIARNDKVAFVVDDITSRDPWRVRCLEIRGTAEQAEIAPSRVQRTVMAGIVAS